MEVLTVPIPHSVTSLDAGVYKYAVASWMSSKGVNHELRYNIPIHDTFISSYINDVTYRAYELLLPYIKEAYPKWIPNKLTIRSQFAGNLKSDHSYRMRDWHLDNGNKVVIGLWYFKHPDDSNDAGLHISNGTSEKLIPYQENTIVFLPNLPNSWHKVGERLTWTHERRFINIVIEQQQTFHDYTRDHNGVDSMRQVKNLMI